ncbi:MAG TPA: ABC transporter substrate-binding protein [Thermomicrobiales bacterium]|nr:ABC transporter substrate-binding protein [Thermomicrobiales bacterium]
MRDERVVPPAVSVIDRRLTRRGLLRRMAGIAIAVPALSLLAACGSDDDDDGDTPTATVASDQGGSTPAATEAPVEPSATMSAEESEEPESTAASEASPTVDSSASAGSFPVTVEHKFGTTEIASAPERVVSLGYNDQDHLLAFGVTPVAARYWYGDEADVIYPWAEDALTGPEPDVLTMVELDFEAIAIYEPDLIVAIYSGITEDDYATLSRIAPTVAQLGDYIDYGMPWEATTRLVGAALGMPERAEELIEGVEAEFAAAREANPSFDGASVVVASMGTDGSIGLFAEQDGRTRIITSLGLTVAEEILPLFEDVFYVNISGEQMNIIDAADVVIWVQVVFTGGRDVILENPIYQQLTVSREGRHVFVEGSIDDAMAFNSSLSLPYALDALIPHIAAALDGDPDTNEQPMT